MNAKDAILYLYDKGLLNIDAIMKNKDSIMQELDNITEKLTKHDPCRLLRKGDRVQVKERNGRCNGKAGEYLREAFCEVAEDEVPNERVRVFHNSSEYRLDPAYLDLVTPVEELEPYYIEEEDFDSLIYNSNDDPDCKTVTAIHIKYQDVDGGEILSVKSYYESYVYSYEHAKAAAEAECARLNAEYRKEHQK